MALINLQIKNLRNLAAVDVAPSRHFNVIYGENGSGKTSLLEAIHYLGLGRSFRTHLANRVIREQQDSFSIVGQILHNSVSFPIGIERSRHGETQIKARGKSATSIVEVAETLPLQLINSEAHRLLTDGPKYRRQFLDWGVFHVEHSFYALWQRAARAVKQRNAALRFAPREEIELWDTELVVIAEEMHRLRSSYVENFTPLFGTIIKNWLQQPIQLAYYSGWPAKRDLKEALTTSLEHDRQLGYTQYGPHRSDLTVMVENIPAQDRLSQGQQKLVVYALRLAQGMLLQQQTDKHCIYLIDDLPAELDAANREFVIAFLKELNTQVFVTGIEKHDLQPLLAAKDAKLFHVEQGRITNSKVLLD